MKDNILLLIPVNFKDVIIHLLLLLFQVKILTWFQLFYKKF